VVVVSHSYGALTALFLAIKHPELVRALVLASCLRFPCWRTSRTEEAVSGEAAFDDIQRRMVTPIQQSSATEIAKQESGCLWGTCSTDTRAWDKMSESSRQETLREANEWDVMITTGTLFPEIEPQTIRKIRQP
jgi:pimeloyl-ACP methyl ester carboxylesterase